MNPVELGIPDKYDSGKRAHRQTAEGTCNAGPVRIARRVCLTTVTRPHIPPRAEVTTRLNMHHT
jgi:hypothetical protein